MEQRVSKTNTCRTKLANGAMKSWCNEIKKLTEIAKSQPHAAYAAFIHGEQHKFTYFMRTIANISDTLKPLDDAINNTFIPILFGREITDNEREIISMPIREGGLGLRAISNNSEQSYHCSSKITRCLVNQIITQSEDLPDVETEQKDRREVVTQVKQLDSIRSSNIKNRQEFLLQRVLHQASEPGASSWLGALPIEAQGFNLNKGEFQDSLRVRYLMQLENLPSMCPCGEKFDLTHAMKCTTGGFIHARHDNIRDMEFQLLQVVCNDVEKEPHLQKVVNKQGYEKSAITDDDARLDVRARGFWRRGQNSFFDVRVTHPNNTSQRNTKLETILKKHEDEKKRHYNRRVREVEQGSFTPLVFTTTGVMSHECTKYHKALAEKLSEKQGERYDVIMRYLRVKLSFLAQKATLLCLRGSRRGKGNVGEQGEDFGFSLDQLGL